MNFFYLLTLLFYLNSALALRCYTGATYGYNVSVNSSSLIDCQYTGIRGYSCMKMVDYVVGVTVRFCNNYNCSQMLQGRFSERVSCLNDTYGYLKSYGFAYRAIPGVNYSPAFTSHVTLCCCSGDGCNSGETIKSLEKEAIQNFTDEAEYRVKVLNSAVINVSKDLRALYALYMLILYLIGNKF